MPTTADTVGSAHPTKETMADDKAAQKTMKLACNMAAFRQPLPACPYCGGAMQVVSRSESFASVAVAVQCSQCKKSLSRTVTK